MDILNQTDCKGIGLGLESGNDATLKLIGKGFTTFESEKAIRNLSNIGIKSYGYFIVGFPWEDENQIRQTLDFAYNLSRKYSFKAGVVPYKVYPGSKDFRKIVGENPSRGKIDKLIRFKSAALTHPNDSAEIREFLKGRERYTVLHDPEYYNPSTIDPQKIVWYIREFYLRSRFS